MIYILSESFYWVAFYVFLGAPFLVFLLIVVLKVKAPYGRFTSNAWGKGMMSSHWAWILMECPSSLIFLAYFITFAVLQKLTLMQVVFFGFWQFHYAYRSFIYPNLARLSRPMPLGMMFSAFSFQMFNTFFQVRWVFEFAPQGMYSVSYLYSPQFIVGALLFLAGSRINRQSDHILRNLRKLGETDYKIPHGGMFHLVSCPNYLGEMIIWLGWAIMLWHWVGAAFFFWTMANLAPRAITTHNWYLETFEDYPKNRKALVPYIL